MENKKTEKYALLNLIRALSGKSEQTDSEVNKNGAEDCAPADGGQDAPPAENGINILEGILERHDKISNRIKSNHKK